MITHNVLVLSSHLTKKAAISRIRKGYDVMSRSKNDAKSAAYIAGGWYDDRVAYIEYKSKNFNDTYGVMFTFKRK